MLEGEIDRVLPLFPATPLFDIAVLAGVML
jgi:hypothetical protein